MHGRQYTGDPVSAFQRISYYNQEESSYYLTLNKDNKTKPLTILYYRDVGAFDRVRDSFILITTKEKPENEEENRYFYMLKKYER